MTSVLFYDLWDPMDYLQEPGDYWKREETSTVSAQESGDGVLTAPMDGLGAVPPQ